MEITIKKIVIIFLVCMIGLGCLTFAFSKNVTKNNQSKTKIKDEVKKPIEDNKTHQEKTTQDLDKTENIEQAPQQESQENQETNLESSETVNQNYNYIPVDSFNVKIPNNRLYIGDTTQLITTIIPSNATEQEISYQSSNKNIAIVSKTGVVTAVNVGECTITITVKNVGSGTLKVTVLSKNNTTYNNQEQTNSNSSTISGSVEYKNNIQINPSSNSNNSIKDDSLVNNENPPSNQVTSEQQIPTQPLPSQPSNSVAQEEIKNGWYTINNKKYYYKNNKKLTNTYIDYIYLNNNGVAQEKVGNFSATLYGAIAWANQNINIRKEANQNSKVLGTIKTGGKMKILSAENSSTKYIKVKYRNIVGYVYSNYIYINLPDIIPDIIYNISNANKSIYRSAGVNIPNITGKNLYGYSMKYNEKINKTTYYVPLLYPVAKQLQKAYNKAVKQGYNLKIYDTYRPYDISKKINKEFKQLYNSNKKVKKAVNYDKDGSYWGTSWFLANSISMHNRGAALDLTLTDKNNIELNAQTTMHTLDARSVTKYNNAVAKKLNNIMTSVGFETLKSEWWHFQEDDYKSSTYNSFKIS